MRKLFGIMLLVAMVILIATIIVPATAADPAGGIAGRVTTQNISTGIAGAAVRVVDPDNWSQVYYYGVSNAQGFYQFVGVNTTGTPSGYYRIIASVDIDGYTCTGYSNNFSVEANSTAYVNVRIYISGTPTPPPIPTPTPVTGGIAGRVTTQDTTRGIANATLKVVDSYDNSSVFCTGVSDPNGFYQFVGVNTSGAPSGYYQVIASADFAGQTYEGYSNNFRVEADSTAAVNVIIYIPDPTPTPTPSPQPGTGGIAGRVTTQDTTRGIANATVRVVDPYNWDNVYYTSVTDANGFYQFAGVNTTGTPSGYYQLSFWVPVGDMTYEVSSDYFIVEANSTVVVNAIVYIPEPPRTGGISGRVTTQDTTNGIANATIKVVDPDDISRVLYIGVSDPDGFYQFVGVNITGTPSGYYEIIASADINGQTYEGYSDNFVVEENSTAAVNVVIYIPESPRTGGISGRVTTQNTTLGIANVTVMVVDPDDLYNVFYTCVSDQNGFFQFVGVNISGTPSGQYKIIAMADIDGQTCIGYSNNFMVEENSTTAVNIVIEVPAPTAPGNISGRVTFNGNLGAPYATVKVVDAADPSVVYYTGTANSRGYFQFTGVNNTWDPASGQYASGYKVYATFRIGFLKWAGYSDSFAVEADSTAAVNVRVARAP